MDPESSVRDDRAACFYIGSATTWPVHTLEWFDDMDQAKFDAVDRDLKAVLKEASAFPTPPVSERARLMNQAINGCHALGLPIFGPRRHVEATEGDIDACAIVSKVPPDASYAESDAPLVRAWREAEDFWLWVRLYHLNWGAGDPKFARLRDSTLGRCRIIHANEATPSSGD